MWWASVEAAIRLIDEAPEAGRAKARRKAVKAAHEAVAGLPIPAGRHFAEPREARGAIVARLAAQVKRVAEHEGFRENMERAGADLVALGEAMAAAAKARLREEEEILMLMAA